MGFENHVSVRRLNSLPNGLRPFADRFELSKRQATREIESSAVVLDHNFPRIFARSQTNFHGSGTAVSSDVAQSFFDDADQIFAYLMRNGVFVDVTNESRHNAGLSLEGFQ